MYRPRRLRQSLALAATAIVVLTAGLVAAPPATSAAQPANPSYETAALGARSIDTGGVGTVTQIEYSARHDTLIARIDRSEVRIYDGEGRFVDSRLPVTDFSDIAVTPDGHFFFVADEGRTHIGSGGRPATPHYVHRYDIRRASWAQLEAPWVAPRIEAVSSSRVLIQEIDQHVDVSLNSFSVFNNEMVRLDNDPARYGGDFDFNPNNGLIYHGTSGSSDVAIHVLKLTGDTVTVEYDSGSPERTSTEGGGSTVLNADGTHFFYGRLQVDASNVLINETLHDEVIVAATMDWAIDVDGDLYHLDNGRKIDGPTWQPSAISATFGTNIFWLAQPDSGVIFRCATTYTEVGCPRPLPVESACDTPTIDMNTNGGNGTGTAGDDIILGTPGDDVIRGGGGNDLLCGKGGNDIIHAGPGDDDVFGGSGEDTVTGGPGDDIIYGGDDGDILHGYRGDDLLIGGPGNDRMFGYAGGDLLDGGDGNDRLHGNFGDDSLLGGDGDDALFGYGDDDFMLGGGGNDIMSGNFGNDIMVGDDGNDTMYGADGNDAVDGGAGDDIVNGNSLDDSLLGGAGNDALDGGIGYDQCNGADGIDTATRCEETLDIP